MHPNFKRVALSAICAGLFFSATTHAADLKLGALYPLSGGLAALGEESFRGIELAVEERNAAGGINGDKVVLVKGDAVDANQAVGEARRLTSVENVKAIFGSYASGISIAATQVTELAGVPYFELGAVADSITDRGFKYVFRTNATAKAFATSTVEAVSKIVAPALGKDPKSLRVAIIYEDGPYGTMLGGFQKAEAKKLGLNVVEELAYSAKSVDLSAMVLRLKGSKADVVLQTSYQNDTILFLRKAQQSGFKPKAIIGAGGGYSMADTAKVLGPIIEGALDVDFPQASMKETGAPGLSTFVKAYQARYKTDPRSGHSLANYAGAKEFMDILAAAKSTDKDKVRAAALAVHKPLGSNASGGGLKFGENGQNTLALVNLMQWQKGKLMTVYPPAVANAKVVIQK
jgi:branched-chain amino acid transport system substrate-binding protein